MLSSGVVTDKRVPALIRHTLNLESGLNDGLALPAVLTFAAALQAGQEDFVWWHFVLQDVGLGLLFGLLFGVLGSVLMPAAGPWAGHSIPARQKAIYGLGLAFATYGISVIPPHGNGFIAVFVAAIVVGNRRADLRRSFAEYGEEIVEVVKLGIFAVFGSLLTFDALFHDGWAALAVVAGTFLLARPVAIFAALAGTRVPLARQALHGLVRPQGGRHDHLLAADPGTGRRRAACASSISPRWPCSARSSSTGPPRSPASAGSPADNRNCLQQPAGSARRAQGRNPRPAASRRDIDRARLGATLQAWTPTGVRRPPRVLGSGLRASSPCAGPALRPPPG